MRVLHVYSGNLYGGIERVLATLARSRHFVPGMKPAFGLCFRGRLWDELAATGAPVFDLGPVRFSRPWTVWRARLRLAQLLRREQFDVLLTHASWPHAVFAPVVRRPRVVLATWVHDALNADEWIHRRATRTRPDVVIANSRFTSGTAGAVFPGVPVEVVHYPVDTLAPRATGGDLRLAVRAELATPPDAFVVLQASRLERWKGAAVLVEALGRLKDRPHWVAWVAGGPQRAGEAEFRAEIAARAAALGVGDRVRFLGQRSDVPRLMAAADVFCQPNTGPEPFGVVFVEALAAGLPVVATAIGGAAEIVTSDCGILAPPADPALVADALDALISDPARRRRLGAAGPARAAQLCDPAERLRELATVLQRTRAAA